MHGRTVFDGFTEGVTKVVSSAYFFALCAAGVIAWVALGPSTGYSTQWQLAIDTATAITTFLMVAVLANSSRRGERALQAKLDAIADALADFMHKSDLALQDDVRELQDAVGLEDRVGSK
ncbi:MAG: low affinity iron permease family protein [Candidatus Thermoplasmatota archaeon]